MSVFLTKTNPPVASSAVLSFAATGGIGSAQKITIDSNEPMIDPTGVFIATPFILEAMGEPETSFDADRSEAPLYTGSYTIAIWTGGRLANTIGGRNFLAPTDPSRPARSSW
jgi:hypothetical protein